MHFDSPVSAKFTVDAEKRTIRGLAVPYGDVATSEGQKWSFSKGSLSWDRAKVLINHDWSQAVGTAEFEDTDEGLFTVMKIARGAEGDRLLSLAEDGVFDGLSIGLGTDVKAALRQGVQHVLSGSVREVSATPIPAFNRARVTSVAASAAHQKETHMEEQTPVKEETPKPEVTAPTFSDEDIARIADAVTAKFSDEKRPVVPAGRPVPGVEFVSEEPLYRFSGAIPGKHSFSQDVINGVINHDAEAYGRVVQFMSEQLLNPKGLQFVDTTDTAAVNPARYRPDMFLDEGPAQPTPLYDAFYKGGLSDVTPFFYSKLDAYSGLLADHTEGTEPTAGTFATESGATVTPAPISGKIHITREVGDQGGNPQVSGLVWSKFQRVFRQMLESKTFGIVNAGAAGYATFASPAAGATGAVLGQALEDGLVDLQFTADGSRFTRFFSHVDLYKRLAGALDGQGRKLYPIINPANADGSSSAKFAHINVAGINLEPAWSLGGTATTASNSYYVDPSAVHVWNSGLTKLEKLNEDVEGWDIGAWAYFAGILYDASGIKKVPFDPTA